MPPNELWDEYLTIKDLCTIFGRTPMTIYAWRKRLGLPTIIIKANSGHSIRFEKSAVYTWAKEHDKEVVKEL